MKRLFKTFSIFCLACVLLSACSQQPPDTAPVQEPVQDGAVEEAPVYVYLTRHGQTLTNQTGRFVSGRGNTPLCQRPRQHAAYRGRSQGSICRGPGALRRQV